MKATCLRARQPPTFRVLEEYLHLVDELLQMLCKKTQPDPPLEPKCAKLEKEHCILRTGEMMPSAAIAASGRAHCCPHRTRWLEDIHTLLFHLQWDHVFRMPQSRLCRKELIILSLEDSKAGECGQTYRGLLLNHTDPNPVCWWRASLSLPRTEHPVATHHLRYILTIIGNVFKFGT